MNTIVGKVFIDPVTKKGYGGIIRLPKTARKFSTLDGIIFDALADDGVGNFFTTALDGTVFFWDHETDDLTRIASSVAEFVGNCVVPEPVELDPSQVMSVWIDPTFAKSIGKDVPNDGWVKKPNKPKLS